MSNLVDVVRQPFVFIGLIKPLMNVSNGHGNRFFFSVTQIAKVILKMQALTLNLEFGKWYRHPFAFYQELGYCKNKVKLDQRSSQVYGHSPSFIPQITYRTASSVYANSFCSKYNIMPSELCSQCRNKLL